VNPLFPMPLPEVALTLPVLLPARIDGADGAAAEMAASAD
jgi:hypothetical protein